MMYYNNIHASVIQYNTVLASDLGPEFYFEEIRVLQAGIRLEYISVE